MMRWQYQRFGRLLFAVASQRSRRSQVAACNRAHLILCFLHPQGCFQEHGNMWCKLSVSDTSQFSYSHVFCLVLHRLPSRRSLSRPQRRLLQPLPPPQASVGFPHARISVFISICRLKQRWERCSSTYLHQRHMIPFFCLLCLVQTSTAKSSTAPSGNSNDPQSSLCLGGRSLCPHHDKRDPRAQHCY